MRAQVCCRRRGRTKDRDIKALPIEDHGDTDAILSMTQTPSLQHNICRDLNRRNAAMSRTSDAAGRSPYNHKHLLAANTEYQTCE
jgi:hypothetical protein